MLLSSQGLQNKSATSAFHWLFWILRCRLLRMLVGQFWVWYWRNKMEIAAYFLEGTFYSKTYWQPWFCSLTQLIHWSCQLTEIITEIIELLWKCSLYFFHSSKLKLKLNFIRLKDMTFVKFHLMRKYLYAWLSIYMKVVPHSTGNTNSGTEN